MAWDRHEDPLGRKDDVDHLKREAIKGNVGAKRALQQISEESTNPRLKAARKELIKAVHNQDSGRREEVEHDIAKMQGQPDVD